MEKRNYYHLIILDASGSMDIIRQTALNGCNETIQHIENLQKKAPAEEKHFLSLVVFNSSERHNHLYDCSPIEEVMLLSLDKYVPEDCTPLYDAIGFSCKHLEQHIDKTSKADKNFVLATIITDGQENDSTEFNADNIRRFVEQHKDSGWTFAFIGANQDEVFEAQKLGIKNTLHFEQDAAGTAKMFKAFRRASSRFCEAAATESLEERLFD